MKTTNSVFEYTQNQTRVLASQSRRSIYIYIYIYMYIYIYIYIIYTLRQRGVFHLQNKNIRYRAVFKITLNTIILVCLCYPTFLPLIVYIGHWTLVLELENEDQMVTRSWIYSFGSLNNCVNLYIYASRTKRFKKASYRFRYNIIIIIITML